MGIRFSCPNGHKLHVKAFLAGRRGICPQCGAKIQIPNATDDAEAGSEGAISTEPIGARPLPHSGSLAARVTASPSIIIEVAEEPAPRASAGPVIPASLDVSPPSVPAELGRLSPDPSIADESSSSPAARYIARRQRNRRNQVTIAVVLLISVIVLAVVLILVLQRGSAAAVTHAATIPPDADFGRVVCESHRDTA
jgi:hypothetical protein